MPQQVTAETLADKTYYSALTGVRAIAAYMVFLHHFNPLAHKDGTPINFPGKLLGELHVGVTIFFVLSGFLITSRYLGRVQTTWPWAKQYLRNRVARIYPLYFLLTVLTFGLSASGLEAFQSIGWPTFSASAKVLVPLLNLTFLRGFFVNTLYSGISQGWSLTVEECFYLSAPLLLLALARTRKAIVLFPLLVLPGILLVEAFGEPDRFNGFFGSYRFMFHYTFFGRSIEFIGGMGLAVLLDQYQHLKQMRTGVWYTALGALWIGACVATLAISQHSPADNSNWLSIDPLAIGINNLVLPIGVVSLFYGLIHERSWLSSVLQSKLFDQLGKSSYAFYLVHMGILSTTIYSYVSSNYAVIFLLTNIVAFLLYKFVETPMHKLITGR